MYTKEQIKDVAIRAGKTFLQAFVAVLAAGSVNVTHLSVPQGLIVSAAAAGVSALLNLLLSYLNPVV